MLTPKLSLVACSCFFREMDELEAIREAEEEALKEAMAATDALMMDFDMPSVRSYYHFNRHQVAKYAFIAVTPSCCSYFISFE